MKNSTLILLLKKTFRVTGISSFIHIFILLNSVIGGKTFKFLESIINNIKTKIKNLMSFNPDLQFTEKYINTNSPSGFEEQAQDVWEEQLTSQPNGNRVEIKRDNYGNSYATLRSSEPNPTQHLIIDAHADEIGFLVSDITKDGYIRVRSLGGADITITASTRVNIWPLKEQAMRGTPVKGVFGHPAIHVHRGDYKFKTKDSFIDLGLSSDESVKALGIKVGSPITMDREFFQQGDYYAGKSLDDKMGGVITSTILTNLLKDNVKLDFTLTIINSVQEEVGLHGAQMSIDVLKSIEPGARLQAIAIDVCHCTNSPAYS